MSDNSLLTVLKRSWWIVALYVAIAIVAVNVFLLFHGPRYEASSIVTISPFDVPTAIARQDPTVAEPGRDVATQVTLARSDELYLRAAEASDSEFGSADELKEDVEVSGSNAENLITFTANSDSEDDAAGIAQLMGVEFINWRTESLNDQVDRAIATIDADPASSPATNAGQVARLEDLRAAAASSYTLVERATEPEQTAPDLLRGSALGIALGLVIGLLTVGLREAFVAAVQTTEDAERLLDLPALVSLELPYDEGDDSLALGQKGWDGLELIAGIVSAGRRAAGEPLAVAALAPSDDSNSSVVAAGLAIALSSRGTRVLMADVRGNADSASALLLSHHGDDGPPSEESGVWEVAIQPQQAPDDGAGDGAWPRPTEILVARGHVDEASPKEISSNFGVSLGADDAMVVDPRPALLAADGVDLSAGGTLIVIIVSLGRTPRRSLRSLSKQMDRWPSLPIGIAIIEASASQRSPISNDRARGT